MKKILLIFCIGISIVSLRAQTIESVIKAKPFEVSGSLGGNLGLYSVSGIDERTSPFQYGLSARLTFKIYSFSVPVYASIRDNSFNYGGSYSRFRINPQYKWVKLHLGDTYMNFSPYTLSGRTVKGYGIELTPGNFRLKFVKGKMEDLRSYTDTLRLGTTFVPTYKRQVTALGIGYGSRSTYVDLYAVNTADRLDSLNGEQVIDGYTRKSNTVLGSAVAVRLGKSISVKSNIGLSLQTDNLDSFGENTTVGENPISGSLLEGNISSDLTYAGDVSIGYNNRLFSLNGKVKYIQPYYQPLTVAFINSDIINYTIGGSTSLFKRKLNLIGSIGVQRNNLTGSKLSTANNLITTLAANFRLSKKLSGTINYSNFTQDYEARLIQINDLYTYAINNNVATASLRYVIKKGDKNYKIGVTGGRNSFLTVDDSEENLNAYDSYNGAFSVGMNNTERHTNIRTSITYRKYNRELNNSANYGMRINLSKVFRENLLRTSFNTAFVYNDRDGLREGTTFRNGLTITYNLKEKSNISLRLNHIRRTSTVRSNFSEYRSTIQYSYRF